MLHEQMSKIFGPENFLVQNHFDPEIFWIQINVISKKRLFQEKFQINFRTKQIWIKFFFGSKHILGQNIQGA